MSHKAAMSKAADPDRINYKVSGTGEPLILIHGVGGDHTMWEKQVGYFSSYYKTYTYDTVGHGQSEKPDRDCYTLKDYTDQLNNLMCDHQIDSAYIVGFSMGGMIAQAFAIAYPEKVKKLVLANAVANRTEEESKRVQDRVEKVEKEGRISVFNQSIERWYTPGYLKENPSIISDYKKRVKQTDEKAYVKAYRLFATADKELWSKLDKINCPVLIITGENDIGSNPRMAKDMHRKISNSKVVIVPEVKHQLPIEQPKTFNKHVHEFLSET